MKERLFYHQHDMKELENKWGKSLNFTVLQVPNCIWHTYKPIISYRKLFIMMYYVAFVTCVSRVLNFNGVL